MLLLLYAQQCVSVSDGMALLVKRQLWVLFVLLVVIWGFQLSLCSLDFILFLIFIYFLTIYLLSYLFILSLSSHGLRQQCEDSKLSKLPEVCGPKLVKLG